MLHAEQQRHAFRRRRRPHRQFRLPARLVVVSSDGTSNGIVWIMDTNANGIHAYSASDAGDGVVEQRAEKSGGVGRPGRRGEVGGRRRWPTARYSWAPATVWWCTVLTQPPTAVPDQPTLAAARSPGRCELDMDPTRTASRTWRRATPSRYSTDDAEISARSPRPRPAQLRSPSAVCSPRLVLFPHLRVQTNWRFAASNVVSVTTTTSVAAIIFSGGFAGAISSLTLNGSAALNGSNWKSRIRRRRGRLNLHQTVCRRI